MLRFNTLTSLSVVGHVAAAAVRRASTVTATIEADLGHNAELAAFVSEFAAICKPDAVQVCDGSKAEFDALMHKMIATEMKIELNPEKRPGSYLTRTDPRDTARSEERTIIACESESEAGPTNNWADPKELREKLDGLMDGAMVGRTLYVCPFTMGPLDSPMSRMGVQLTDSPHVAATLRVMTRMGKETLDRIGTDGEFVRCVHSVLAPLTAGAKDATWPCRPDDMYITHFPEQNLAISVGCGTGGNALLPKKAFALRLASSIGRREGWLAEHMLVIGVTNPAGEKKYFAAAAPSACGKTNLALLQPSLPGWKVEVVGDDIAWLKFDDAGQLRAINPEAGFYGVAPGTSWSTNPVAMETMKHDAVFTNVGLTPDGDVWWEGMEDPVPEGTINWLGEVHDPASGEPVAHANSRFCVAIDQCPIVDEGYNDPAGVPISAVLFGGRRPSTIPLIHEALDWNHGVYLGASVASEKTAAASGDDIGVIRHDPFAQVPFTSYHIADYFQHWMNMGKQSETLPKFFMFNWFRQSADGDFLWPGFGENSRVLEWVFNRCDGNDAIATETPIGYTPAPGALNIDNLDVDPAVLDDLLAVDVDAWRAESAETEQYLKSVCGDRMPAELQAEIDALRARLG